MYLQTHPKAAKWRTTTFRLYDDIGALVDDVLASGEGVFRAGASSSSRKKTPPSSSNSSDSSSDADSTSNKNEDASSSEGETTPAVVKEKKPRKGVCLEAVHSYLIFFYPAEKSVKRTRDRKTGASGLHRIADSVTALTDSILQSDDAASSSTGTTRSTLEATPLRRGRAVRLLENEEDMSDNEKLVGMDVFAEDMIAVDMFLAFEKPERRLAFIKRKIAARVEL